jgi:chemotaxis protein CheC
MHKLWDTLNTRLFGIYLTFSGEVTGQCIVIAESEIAYTVIDTITNNPSGTTKSLENVEEAIIGEMGNRLGPILLNAIVTRFRINSQSNPSIVLYDTAAALYDIASTEMGAVNPHMYILETTLTKGNNEMNGTFFIMLNPDIVSSKSGKTSLLRSTT